MKIEQMSMLEVAEMLMAKKKVAQKFEDLAREVAEVKGFNYDEETDKIARFYTDLTMSSKFVYCGEESFNLKDRESTDLYEKEFFEEGQSEVDELQRQLDLMPKKVVEFKQETPRFERIESFIPNFDEEEEIESEETEYLDDVISSKSDYEDEEDDYEDEIAEDEYEDMYDEE